MVTWSSSEVCHGSPGYATTGTSAESWSNVAWSSPDCGASTRSGSSATTASMSSSGYIAMVVGSSSPDSSTASRNHGW